MIGNASYRSRVAGCIKLSAALTVFSFPPGRVRRLWSAAARGVLPQLRLARLVLPGVYGDIVPSSTSSTDATSMAEQPNAGYIDPDLDAPPSPLKQRSPPYAPLLPRMPSEGSRDYVPSRSPEQQVRLRFCSPRTAPQMEDVPGLVELPPKAPPQPSGRAGLLVPLFARPLSNAPRAAATPTAGLEEQQPGSSSAA